MSKQAKKVLVPELRFPEFRKRSGWEAATLGHRNIGEFVDEKVSNEDLSLSTYISTSNILPDYGGVEQATSLPPSGSFTRFQKDDILISNIRPYLKKIWLATFDGAASNDVIVVRPRKNVSPSYLAQLIVNDAYVGYVMKNVQGLKMPRGEKTSIAAYPIVYPQPDEQKKIAACLSSLDALLAAEREKLEALRAHKKGLLQQLFPAEGANVPVRRFPGFKGSWGAEPLGKFTSKVGSGITPRGGDKTYLQEGRIFVRSQNIGWGVLLLDEVAYIDEETHQTFPGTEIQLSDVLLNLSGASIGRCAVANDRLVGGNVNQHVCIIRVNDDIHPVYLEQFILSKPGQKQIDSFQAGGNRQGLNYDQVRSFSIPLPPDKKEQKEIALCLSSMDMLVALQEERIGILEDHKKGLMQGLFPTNQL